jgi:hypothetical protein
VRAVVADAIFAQPKTDPLGGLHVLRTVLQTKATAAAKNSLAVVQRSAPPRATRTTPRLSNPPFLQMTASDNHKVAYGFRHCMCAIAGPELCLCLLKMTADCFFASSRSSGCSMRVCGLLYRLTNRSLAQYRLLPRGQTRI